MKIIQKIGFAALVFFLSLLSQMETGAQDKALKPPTKAQIDKIVAKELGDCDCQKRSIKVAKKGDTLQLTVTDNSLNDDSSKATRTEGTLTPQNGKWIFKKIKETQQCWPGRGHGDFSSKPCV